MLLNSTGVYFAKNDKVVQQLHLEEILPNFPLFLFFFDPPKTAYKLIFIFSSSNVVKKAMEGSFIHKI